MAKILPHLEIPGEVTPLERAYFHCVSPSDGFAGLGDASCPSPNLVVQQAHTGLAMMIYTRRGVELALEGRSFTVQRGNRSGGDQGNIYIVLDPDTEGNTGIGNLPVWSPPASPDASQFKLLSWTSKMNAPSWSIPAGYMDTGGACPGAQGGQSILDPKTLLSGGKKVAEVMGAEPDVSTAICEYCYATGGQYSTGNVQFAQILRYAWAQNAIDVVIPGPDGKPSTLFIETMVAAVESANYKLEGGTIKVEDGEDGKTEIQELPPEPTGKRFFRVHDSGDFFSIEYLRQWCEVAKRCPDITFWAPSRVWAAGQAFRDAVNRYNTSGNFTIRPSAYNVNGFAPPNLGPGWAAGTVVVMHSDDRGMTQERMDYVKGIEHRQEEFAADGPDPRYTWSCRAYATNDQKHTCRKAVAPPGHGINGIGCRSCWVNTDEVTMYTLH